MSITQRETSEFVSKYLLERYGKSITANELLQQKPWHLIVWYKFMANAYYKIKDHYESWDDVPKPYYEGMLVSIVTVKIMDNYQYRNGKWSNLGSCTADCWKE